MKNDTVDALLNKVDYTFINNQYVPEQWAIEFLTFIKLVNGAEGEENSSPAFHTKMLSALCSPSKFIANLCFRGSAKTTMFAEYLILYIAVFGSLPYLGRVKSAIYLSDSMDNGVRSLRKNVQYRYESSEFLQKHIKFAKFTEIEMKFTNTKNQVLNLSMYGAKTGLRGNKSQGSRPNLAILDDLVSDDDARSATAMASIKDTVFKGVINALLPKSKIIFNGTPFNKNDILYEAVESGGWEVNVYPICERFPCEEHEFVGAWEDRFSYKFVKETYEFMVKNGRLDAFNQELMLRIASEEDRLVKEHEVVFESIARVKLNIENYNIYITTDFSVGGSKKSDYSVISVWAYSHDGKFYLIDGYIGKVTIDVSFDELFSLVQKWNPLSVGIETNGQQLGFISLINKEMLRRGIWFNLASVNNGKKAGVRATSDKLTRFTYAVPLFRLGRIILPEELRETMLIRELLEELRLVMHGGFKSKNDDVLDTISMLPTLNTIRPSPVMDKPVSVKRDNMYYNDHSKYFARVERNSIDDFLP